LQELNRDKWKTTERVGRLVGVVTSLIKTLFLDHSEVIKTSFN